jgi:putative ABC transport system substrate-binding protein
MLFAAKPADVAQRIESFGKGMAALGHADGRQVLFEPRYANGNLARMPALAAELVAIPCTVILSGGSSATAPLVKATSAIPIVTGQDNDPVAAGHADSYARPGRNVTGLATLTPELGGKQVGVLVELVPGIRHIAIFGDGGEAGNAQAVAEAERAAAALQTTTMYVDSRGARSVADMFAAATRARAGGALVLQSAFLYARMHEVVDLARKSRLPAIYANTDFGRHGGLACYGVNAADLFLQAAAYVVKILNGARPAELPIERPRTFELVINLRAANEIGITVPRQLLLRADDVVQ